MKKIVLFHVCMMLLSVNLYPQNILDRQKLPYEMINPLRTNKNVYPAPEDDHLPLNMPRQMQFDKNKPGYNLNTVIFNPVLIIMDSTRRETYTYYDNGGLKLYTSQELKNGAWETWRKITVTYADNGRVRVSYHELSQNDTLTSSSSVIDTLDAKGNLLSSTNIMNDEVRTRDVYTYTDDGKLLTTLYQQFQYNQLMSADRTAYTYSEKGEILIMLSGKWKDNAWINVQKFTNTYDDMGNQLTSLCEGWENGTWVTSSKSTDTYDDKGNLLTSVTEYWKNGAIIRTTRTTWTNDSNGNHLICLQENLVNGTWVNLARETYTYDSNNNMTSYTSEKWTDGSWINSTRCTYIYENYNMLSDVTEKWYNGAWLKTIKHDYKYDNYGNAVKGESFKWAAEAEAWAPAAGQMVLYYDKGKGFIFLNNSIVEIQYVQFTGVEDIKTAAVEFKLLQNYPNPFNPATTISYFIPKTSFVELKVFDMLGREVQTLVNKEQSAGDYKVQFNASGIPSGMYLYRIRVNDFTKSGKMLLLK